MGSAPDPGRAEAIAATYAGFRAGRDGDVATVRGWVEVVVRAGSWRFADPEGVVQDVTLKLLKLAEDDRVDDPGRFQKFAYSVAKNTCVTLYHRERRRGRRGSPADDAPEPATDAPGAGRLERAERLERLAEILQRLPAACRELWDRIYRARAAPAAVAEELGISPGNLRVRVHRCTEKAREIRRRLERNGVIA